MYMINAKSARALTAHHYDPFWNFIDDKIQEVADRGQNIVDISGFNPDFDIPDKSIIQKTVYLENGFTILSCEVDPFYFHLEIQW